ncbi:nickel transporter, partial [Streptomyces sp. M41]
RKVFALPPAAADRAVAGAPEAPGGAGTAPVAGPAASAGPAAAAGPVAATAMVPGQAPGPVPGQAPVAVPVPLPVPGQGPVPAQGQVPGQVPAQAPVPAPGAPGDVLLDEGRHDAVPHDQAHDHTPPQPHPTSAPTGRRRRAVAQPAEAAGTPAQGVPAQGVPAQGGQAPGDQGQGVPVAVPGQSPSAQPVPGGPLPAEATPGQGVPAQGTPAQGVPAPQPWPAADGTAGAGIAVAANGAATPVPPQPSTAQQAPQAGSATQAPSAQAQAASGTPVPGTPLPDEAAGRQRAAQPLPAEAGAPVAPVDPNSTQGRAISVRTLGQGVPFTRQAAQVQQPAQSTATPPPHQGGGGGRRRKLGTPPDPATRTGAAGEQAARPHPSAEQSAAAQPGGVQPGAVQPVAAQPVTAQQVPAAPPQPSLGGQPPASPVSSQTSQTSQTTQTSQAGQSRLSPLTEGAGRSYAIGAPDENAAEGPEPLDGPGGAVEVADTPRPQPMDDELPPEPLDNPRRLLVWPAPDVTTQQALSDRGYRPVIVHSREEVDAQIAAFPAALFVDPLTGPITRTALQSLRQAAVAAEVPVMVTAGLGQASREAAYGADPAVLLKALAPRDSEQHPPRVLLIEEHAEIALALTATLERRGMQVARAASDADAVTLAGDFRPNLVVMDLMQVHRRRAGIVDWLRANGQLNRTPLVVYTAAVDQADLPRLASGETVLFLAERSTSGEVQSRIVDLLSRIGTN